MCWWLRAVALVASIAACGPTSRPRPDACDAPEVLTQIGTDVPSGYQRCESGLVHRVEAVTCEIPQDAIGSCAEGVPDVISPNDLACVADADCADGFCNLIPGPWPRCACEVPCSVDADCEDGSACYCLGRDSFCVPAHCSTTDDCSGGSRCGLVQKLGGCGERRYVLACTDEGDECRTANDCDMAASETCDYSEIDGHRRCLAWNDLCG